LQCRPSTYISTKIRRFGPVWSARVAAGGARGAAGSAFESKKVKKNTPWAFDSYTKQESKMAGPSFFLRLFFCGPI